MKAKQLWITILLLLFFISQTGWADAQGPNDDQPLGEVENADRLVYDLTWPDLLFEELILGEGGRLDATFNIFLPGDIVPYETGHYVDLVISHTSPQAERPIDLGVSLNNSFLDIIPLTEENAERVPVRIPITSDALQPGLNRLRVNLNRNLPCGETALTRMIAVIHDDSLLHIEYDLRPREPDLAIYPLPFYERTFLPSKVYFVLPENPTVTDISTAASISAGLGIYSSGLVQVASVLESELTEEIKQENHLIIIGKPESVDLLKELDLPFSLDNALIKDDSGVLQEVVSPWNPQKLILVVTGHTDEALLKAGDVLNRDLNFLGMRGPIAIIDQVLPPSQTSTKREVDITFDALNYKDTTIFGTEPQSSRFDFTMSRSWEMSDDAKLTLSLNHSNAIDPEASSLSVLLNRVPIGDTLLNEKNAINGVLEVDLPNWLLVPGRNILEVETSMVMGEDPCENADNNQAWAVIRRDSFLHLPYIEQEDVFDLDVFPLPFTRNSNLTDISLVLPNMLTVEERDRVLQLAVVLGQQAGGERITLRAISAEAVDDAVRASNNLIIVGQPSTNLLLEELGAQLPQPFLPGTDKLAPKLDSAVLIETSIRDGGLLQELASPWNPEKTILAITGTTSQGVISAFDLLLRNLPEELGNVNIAGDLAVIEGDRIHSTDTRLLNPQLLSQKPETVTVQPVTQPGAPPQRELANRWW